MQEGRLPRHPPSCATGCNTKKINTFLHIFGCFLFTQTSRNSRAIGFGCADCMMLRLNHLNIHHHNIEFTFSGMSILHTDWSCRVGTECIFVRNVGFSLFSFFFLSLSPLSLSLYIYIYIYIYIYFSLSLSLCVCMFMCVILLHLYSLPALRY